MTVLFTDVSGLDQLLPAQWGYGRVGDDPSSHDELAARAIQQYEGKVVKTIGDSAMAEFPDPASAVRAAVEIERQFLKLNLTLPQDQRVEVRIGVHTGVGFRRGNDLFGDVVNVAARIVKGHGARANSDFPRPCMKPLRKDRDLHCRWLSKVTIDGRTQKEDIFEVVWTDAEVYRDMQERLAASSHIPARYEVLAEIGTGGTGIVYKVRDLETSEIVALKILKPEIASDPDVQENFKRELCLARKITHKNVCRIHEFNRANGTAYASMELVEGESLSSRLDRVGSLPVNEALGIARQICAGLREAHLQGIVHRDLKPANIMLDRNGSVKIMDFGIARMIHRDGPLTGTIVGTAEYMAPEQAELKPLSPCTDIYSLGLLLYEMITGIAAFSGDTPVAVALKQIRDYPKWPREIVPDLSGAVESVIMKCLQKDAAKRFQSADEFEAALVKAARARPLSPWEAAINRWLARADREIRTFAPGRRICGIISEAPGLARSAQEPKRTRGDPQRGGPRRGPGYFLVLWGWKLRTINAHSVQGAAQNSTPPAVAAHGANSGFTTLPAQNFLQPIASNDVDLWRKVRPEKGMALPVDPGLTNDNLAFDPPAPRSVSQKPPHLVKRVKSPVATSVRKLHADAQVSTQLHALLAPSQPEIPSSASTSTSTALTPEKDLSQPDSPPEPTVEPSITTSQPKAEAGETNAPKLYFEVGSFKDETWANNAVDKLTQLGFHAVLIHKNLLWTQSYHVEVGPYTTQKDIAEARQSLASQGFKAHPVN